MNMSKKTIIQLVIIVAAFGLAGVVLYNGFFSQGSPASAPATLVSSGSPQTPQQILPYGSGPLDFSVLSSRPFVFGQIQYQKLDPNSEVGVNPAAMISSPVPGR
ncbi:MAG: hypothetical protein P4L74_05305 [Candidatus Doudnabacteria bacterium]|nr:hypothetical protein [Candidatus Doudnabacteria bacterium]